MVPLKIGAVRHSMKVVKEVDFSPAEGGRVQKKKKSSKSSFSQEKNCVFSEKLIMWLFLLENQCFPNKLDVELFFLRGEKGGGVKN